MYTAACQAGIQPVAITVPALRPPNRSWHDQGEEQSPDPKQWAWVQPLIAHRIELNSLILEQCRSEQIPYMDFFTATAETPSGFLARRYSNDGLHLTTAGYTLLADLLWQAVFQHVYGTDNDYG